MIAVFLLGLAAVSLAGVAGFFSIIGLAEFAASAAIPIMVFGAVLEASKLIATGFLHYHWQHAPNHLKYTGVFFIVTVMVITMVGIYGFISAAHHNQNTPLEEVSVKMKHIEQQIEMENIKIGREQDRLKQMDEMITGYIRNDRISNATTIRSQQRKERAEVEKNLETIYQRISTLEDQKFELKKSVSSVEAKLGPVKTASRLFGLDETGAVNVFIIMLMIPFDPFAVWLVIATTYAYKIHLKKKSEMQPKPKSMVVEEKPTEVVDPEPVVTIHHQPPIEVVVQEPIVPIATNDHQTLAKVTVPDNLDDVMGHEIDEKEIDINRDTFVPLHESEKVIDIIEDHDDMYVENKITENIATLIEQNPDMIEDLKKEFASSGDVPFPVIQELERVLAHMDKKKQKGLKTWISSPKKKT